VAASTEPLLWHIPISHYNEKVRWALAWKGVVHRRRAPTPGPHMLYALWLTRGASKTFPVLRLDGRAIGDSTEIIAALEERYPQPPLYPAEMEERSRALALEDWFDEELGPHIRLLAWHEVIRDPGDGLDQVAAAYLPRRLRRIGPLRAGVARFGSLYTGLRFGVKSDDAAAEARRRVLAAVDRLEAELGEGDYLVGDSFTVADLTAAALLYPLVLPEEGPSVPGLPPAFEEFRAPLARRRGLRWVAEMFGRHRPPDPAPA
jgi:glutathione S-transferase